jgi:hypothetical protein
MMYDVSDTEFGDGPENFVAGDGYAYWTVSDWEQNPNQYWLAGCRAPQ